MRHSNEIHLSEKLTKAIAEERSQVHAILIDELTNAKEIKSILESYDYLNESRGQVHEFKIKPDSVVVQLNGEGSFEVSYAMEFFYACDAITSKHAQKMIINFKLNSVTGKALFSGEDIPEREPDDL